MTKRKNPEDAVTAENHCETKEALLSATERLLEQGRLDSVTTRAIAKAAHTTPPSIQYYFGNKETLLMMALERLFHTADACFIQTYLSDHKDELSHPEKHHLFLTGMLKYIADNSSKYLALRQAFLQMSRKNQNIRNMMYKLFEPDRKAFHEIYQIITGNSDSCESYAWFLCVILPLTIQAHLICGYAVPLEEHSAEFDANKNFLDFCQRTLLQGWHVV